MSMIEEAMSITPIIFVLVILLFGVDSPDRSTPAGNTITANDRTRDVRVLKSQHIWNPLTGEVTKNERSSNLFLVRLSLTL